MEFFDITRDRCRVWDLSNIFEVAKFETSKNQSYISYVPLYFIRMCVHKNTLIFSKAKSNNLVKLFKCMFYCSLFNLHNQGLKYFKITNLVCM